MKSLRQLLRRPSRSSKADRASKQRRLSTQALEQRQLLAGDVDLHNSYFPADVNQDWKLTARDAVNIINALQRGAEAEAAGDNPFQTDVNNDGTTSALDALMVINQLGAEGEDTPPVVEYLLTARDLNDDPLPVENGIVQVGTGLANSFFLEVSYEDLRTFGADDGAFTVITDIGVSQTDRLRPVLRETQRIIIGEEIRNASSGSLTLTRENSGAQATVTLNELANGPSDAIFDAITTDLGYDTADVEVTEFPTPNENDFGVQIRYIRADDGNVDKDDLTLDANFDVTVPVSFDEFAPFNPDGTPNSDAVRFNINTLSRTFGDENNNNGFGNPFYENLNRGAFDLATGFDDVGGVGGVPGSGGGIPGLNNGNFPEPFDAYSLEVFIDSALTTPLVVDVNPGESVDALLLYGEDNEVPASMILTDEDARVTLSTGPVLNTPPTLGTTPLTFSYTEDDADTTADLLTDASDADGDTLSVVNVNVTGDQAGISRTDNIVSIMPSAYNSLPASGSEDVVFTYQVSDGTVGVNQTATITITGVNDAPVVAADVTQTVNVNGSTTNVDLLDGASDVDTGDVLDVTAVTLESGDNSGITFDDTNNVLVVDPTQYASLTGGQSIDVVYTYNVVDNNSGSTPQRATITIVNTDNDPPVVSGPITQTLSEDDADTTISLLTNVTDPEGDTLSVADFTNTAGDDTGFSQSGTDLMVTPSSYNSLPAGTDEVVEFTYTVSDGVNTPVNHSATVTITGVNDAPVVSGPLTVSLTEDDSSDTIDLLGNASDVDAGDVLTVSGLTLVSGDDSGVTPSGNTVMIDPSAYNALAVGESEEIVYTYTISDSAAASETGTLTINIAGVNDAPIAGPAITATFSEDDADATVTLLDNASDPDTNDSLAIDGFTVASGDGSGVAQSGNSIAVTPSAYNGLAAGAVETIVMNFNVVDGNGGSTANSATITINGVNDAPVAPDFSLTFNEDQGTQTASLLDGASDADGDTLTVTESSVVVTGDDGGITRTGADLSIDTSFYGSLDAGDSVVVTYTYDVTDGTVSVNRTATITIEGRDEGVPTVTGPISVTFDESDPSATVDLLEGASDPDGDPINIANAVITSGDAAGVTIDATNNQLLVDPSAYRALADGETEVIVVTYDIGDGLGNFFVGQTATVTINGQDIIPSAVTSQLWIDEIDNLAEFLNGAPPERNGQYDEGEAALGSILVRLMEVTAEGENVIDTTLTDAEGVYEFPSVNPGTYVVEYVVPDSVQFSGSTRETIQVGETGGTVNGPMLGAIGMTGTMHQLDLLVQTYIAAGIIDTSNLPENLGGGSVQLNEDGTQAMFVTAEGVDVEFAELVLNDSRDAALLSIINESGEVLTARLSADQFVATSDGLGVRFFGSMDSFDFTSSPDDLITSEFDDFRNAIDQILADMN
ncbi:MAG: cadherin-like domain-containing protein [Planctomycetota bacterium]